VTRLVLATLLLPVERSKKNVDARDKRVHDVGNDSEFSGV
jgi:hypothetical protein